MVPRVRLLHHLAKIPGGWRAELTVLIAVSLLVIGIPGCDMGYVPCPKGTTVWTCDVKPTECHYPYTNHRGFCASSMADAIQQANLDAINQLKLKDQAVVGTTCTDTGATKRLPGFDGPNSVPPKLAMISTLDPPSCDPFDGDDVCTACAKSSCCAQYQACATDTNCACVAVCLYQGVPAATCTSVDSCGAPSGVTLAAGACLHASCPSACTTSAGTGTSMCPGMSSSSSSSGGGGATTTTSCTPGGGMANDACVSDDNCASCNCDPQLKVCF
jgi:hypothetical protein